MYQILAHRRANICSITILPARSKRRVTNLPSAGQRIYDRDFHQAVLEALPKEGH